MLYRFTHRKLSGENMVVDFCHVAEIYRGVAKLPSNEREVNTYLKLRHFQKSQQPQYK